VKAGPPTVPLFDGPFHHNRTFALVRSWLWKEIYVVSPAKSGK
jgi:hypothetical protein